MLQYAAVCCSVLQRVAFLLMSCSGRDRDGDIDRDEKEIEIEM